MIACLKGLKIIKYKFKIEIKRTDSSNDDFKNLVVLLDKELSVRDGDDHDFYHQFNQIDNINHVVIAYHDGIALGCGAIKPFNPSVMEVKRMFSRPDFRGKGVASKILRELELWSDEMSYKKCILETGLKQPEAISLYKKNGYTIIDNYGQYIGISTSICFEKKLT